MLSRKLYLDERRKRNLEETSIAVLGMFYIVCTMEMLIKIIVTHQYSNILGELIILLSITFTFAIVQRFNKNYTPMLPRQSNGEELTNGETKILKRHRLRSYAKDAILFALFYSILSIIMNYVLNGQEISLQLTKKQMLEVISSFIIFFLSNTIFNEWRIKKYNTWNKESEE